MKLAMAQPGNRISLFLIAPVVLLLAAPLAKAGQQANPVQSAINALRSRQFQRALALSENLTQAHSSDPRVWTLQGLALQGLGRKSEALKAFQHALGIDQNYIPALEAAAEIEYGAGSAGAQSLLQRLAQLHPADETANAMLAVLSFKRKDCPAAVSHFEKSGEAISSQPIALSEFGQCLVRMGRTPEAVPVFERILALQPADANARYNLGLVQFRARQYAESIQTLLPLARGSSPSASALNLLAAVYEASGETPRAVEALRQAISLAPRDADNYLDLATLSLDHGSYQVGADVVNAGLHELPDSAPLYIERGVLLVQLGRFDEAGRDFEKASALHPAQNSSAVALGILMLQENDLEKSVQLTRQRLKKAPRDPVLNYLLAEALLRQGVKPGSPQFREAENAALRAARYKPGFALADDVLSELYLRAGQTTRAEASARLALKAQPADQAAIYHLIICLRKQGRQNEVGPLVKELSEVSAAAQKQEAARNRFKLVEPTPAAGAAQVVKDQP